MHLYPFKCFLKHKVMPEKLSTPYLISIRQEYVENGALVRAHVPLRFARLLTPMRQTCV